ncbi:DPP IV N-terminal domain-containing protein [Bacteroidota bacterium]
MIKRLLLILIISLNGFISAQTKSSVENDVTVEWMFGDESGRLTALPFTKWLDDGSAILLDTVKPKSQRTFERLNPDTGKRTSYLEMETALNNLRTLYDETPEILDWPEAISNNGYYALFIFENDLFLLRFSDASFIKITDQEEEESAVTFSPNGTKIGFVRGNNIFIYDIKQRMEIQLTGDGSGTILNGTFSWVYWEEISGHRDIAYWWSDNSESIAFLRSDDSEVNISYYTDFEPYQPEVYTQHYPRAGEHTPDVTVGIISLTEKRTVWMYLPPDSYEYIVRVDWIPGSKNVSVQTMNRAQDEIILWRVNRETGEPKMILQEKDDAWLHVYQPYFYKDGETLLWISERNGYTHIYRYNINGEMLNQVTNGDWSLRPFGAFAMYGAGAFVSVDEVNDWIYFTSGKKSPMELHLYKTKPDGSGMERITKKDGTHTVRFSNNSKYYFDYYSTVTTPPSLSLFNNGGSLVKEIAASRNDKLEQYDFQFPEVFTIPAADGFPLPAQMSKPKHFDPAKKYPVIIYVYGGLSAQTVVNEWNTNGWAHSIYYDQVLLKNNYIVFTFDNRAATAKSKILESTIKKQMYGDVELNDLLDAVKWLKSQSYIDPERIGIWGWSGGGTYTLLALTRSKEFKAGISIAPVTDWHYYDAKWAECVMKHPEVNPDGYEKTSLVKRAKDLHGELLLVHGTYDDNVNIQNSWAFANELISENILFDMMIYPMRKHGISDAPARIHLFNTMLEFWKENL